MDEFKRLFIWVYKIKNKFEIKNLDKDSFDMVSDWLDTFDEDLIFLACDKTLAKVGLEKRAFVRYTNAILLNWEDNKIQNQEQVEEYEKKFWEDNGQKFGYFVGELKKNKEDISRDVTKIVTDSFEEYLGPRNQERIDEKQDSTIYSLDINNKTVSLELPNEICDEELDEIKNKLFQMIYKNKRIIPGSYLPDESEKFENIDWSYYFDEKELEDYRKIFSNAQYENAFNKKEGIYNKLYMGGIGRGKTFILNCIGNDAIARGLTVAYFTSVNLFEAILVYKFGRNKNLYFNIIEEIYSYDVLLIDDLGCESINRGVLQSFYELLENRNKRKKTTIMAAMPNFRGSKDIADHYGDVIFSRIYSTSDIYLLPYGNNLSIYKKRFASRK